MFKKFISFIVLLLILSSCSLPTSFSIYNDYNNMLSTFTNNMNQAGHQNLEYNVSIEGVPSIHLSEHQYITSTKDNSYIITGQPFATKVFHLEDEVMYKYEKSDGGYSKKVALKEDYEDYLFIEDFSIPRKYANKINKNNDEFKFKIKYGKLPLKLKKNIHRAFSDPKIRFEFHYAEFVYQISSDQLIIALNIDGDFETESIYSTEYNKDYNKYYGIFKTEIIVDYKPFEKYLFDDISNVENGGNSSIDNVTNETNLFDLFYVNSGYNYFKCNFQKGYYKVVSDLSYHSFDIQIYDQDKNQIEYWFDDFLFKHNESNNIKNTFYITESSMYYINIISEYSESIKIESIEMDSFYKEERYPLSINAGSTLNKYDYDSYVHTSEYDNVLCITNTKENITLYFIDEFGHWETIQYNQTYKLSYKKGSVNIALKALSNQIFVEDVYPLEYTFDIEVYENKNQDFAEFSYPEKMEKITEEFSESFFLGISRNEYYFILNTKEAGFYSIITDVVNSFSDLYVRIKYKNVDDHHTNQFLYMDNGGTILKANTTYYVFVEDYHVNEIRIKYEYTPVEYIDTLLELKTHSGSSDYNLTEFENSQEYFYQYVRYHFELFENCEVKFGRGIIIYNEEGKEITDGSRNSGCEINGDFSIIELPKGRYYCVQKHSKEVEPYIVIAINIEY